MPDFRLTIDLRDVAAGDADSLAEEILAEYGDAYDADRGDFTVRVQQRVGDRFYDRDPGDDAIEA